MTTREKKVILKAILAAMRKDKIPNRLFDSLYHSGICVYIDEYFIKTLSGRNYSHPSPEYREFKNWFRSQRPTSRLNKEYFDKEYEKDVWWWPNFKFEPRERFVEHLIKKRIR